MYAEDKTGKLKVLAVLNSERLPMVKDFPAISESKALKDFTFTIWTGYFVKKDTPEPIVRQLNGALIQALAWPEVRQKLQDISAEPTPMTAREFGDFLQAEVVKWKKLVQDSRLSIQP